MAYFASDKVNMAFPSAVRGNTSNDHIESRILSESTLTKIFSNVNDGRYVISYTDNIVAFMLDGYYFEVDISTVPIDNNTIGLYVTLGERTNDELDGDYNNNYRGLLYNTTGGEDYFQLLTYNENTWEITDESKIKIKLPSTIDCGLV